MGVACSRDVAVLIARFLTVSEVHAVLSTCRAARGLDTEEFWRRLHFARFGSAPSTNESARSTMRSRDWMERLRLDPLNTFGGHLEEGNTLFVAANSNRSNKLDNLGWRLSRFNGFFDERFPRGRFYFEVRLIWTNPEYGDIVVGFANESSGGKKGTADSCFDTCPSWGFYFNLGGKRVHIFSGWGSSWNMGSCGPVGQWPINLVVPEMPCVISCLYDRTNQTLRFALDGKMLEHSDPCVLPPNCVVRPFVILYSDESRAQLVLDHVYPQLAESFLNEK